jgi:hypothetical protein
VLCPRHKVETRPVRSERGQIEDICYLCERETKQKEELVVLKKQQKRDRQED